MIGDDLITDRFSSGRFPPAAWGGGDGAAPARALVITCAAGCLPVGALEAQLEPAGLIVVRNAGNLVPPFGLRDPLEQAIEDAIVRSGVGDVVVCGHAGCASLARLFDARLALDDLPLAAWLEHAEAVRCAALALAVPAAERAGRACELNVTQQLSHLRSYPAVAAGLSAGRLRLLGWLLDPARGVAFAADPVTGRFSRRAALDPRQNHLFRKERLRSGAAPLASRDLGSRYLA